GGAALPRALSHPVPGRGVAQRPRGNAPVTRARAAACLAGPPPPRRRSAPTTLPVPGREIYFFSRLALATAALWIGASASAWSLSIVAPRAQPSRTARPIAAVAQALWARAASAGCPAFMTAASAD